MTVREPVVSMGCPACRPHAWPKGRHRVSWYGAGVMWPLVDGAEVAWTGSDGMREIDRVMVDELGVSLLQMMENAGRWLAEAVRAEHGPGSSVVVLAGGGGNGGGGLASARHLANAGLDPSVRLVVARDRLGAAAAHQLAILERMGVPVSDASAEAAFEDVDVVVDAMVGYSLRGPLGGVAATVSAALSETSAKVVSLDVPSGVSADGGDDGVAVRADMTVTLCLPKRGLRSSDAVGRLLLADISVPPSVVVSVVGGPAPPFWLGPMLELRL